VLTDRERTKALGEWGERKALMLLEKAGFINLRNMNTEMTHHPFADIYGERGGVRYTIGVKTRNKYQKSGLPNPSYNVRKRSAGVEIIAHKYNAQLAWVAIQVIPEQKLFSAYFGTIAQIESQKERFSIPVKPTQTATYERLTDQEREFDATIRPEWTNGGYQHFLRLSRV